MTTETRHLEIDDTFTFRSDSVVHGFSEHVREQLPWYDLVTQAVAQIARHFIPNGGLVYDIGAANGNVGRALAPLLEERNAVLLGIEPSRAMCEAYQAPGEVVCCSAEAYPYEPYDLGVCMLALMFVPPAHRRRLILTLREKVRTGGALVIVERMLPPHGYPSIITSRLTLAAKLAQGALPEEIIAKELSLSGVQRPLAEKDLGMGAVEWFRFGDFAGYLIEGGS